MFKKFLTVLLCGSLVLTTFTGCSNSDKDSASISNTEEKDRKERKEGFAKEPSIVLIYAENQAADYPTSKGAYYFADQIYEKTKGEIEVVVQTDAVLGDEKSVAEQMQYGGLDFTCSSLSSVANFNDSLNVLLLPYLYRDAEHMWEVLEGEIGQQLLDSFEGTGLVALSWYDAGARSFYTTEKPIKCLEDMKGLVIRVQENSLMMDMVAALGGNPTPMTYAEVYSALQGGVIEGAENNFPSYYSTSHYEAAKYITIDEHNRVPDLQLISEHTWNLLTDEYKAIIQECAQLSAEYERQLWAEYEQESYDAVVAAGSTVIELSAEEKERFQEACRPLYEQYAGDYMEIVDKIMDRK